MRLTLAHGTLAQLEPRTLEPAHVTVENGRIVHAGPDLPPVPGEIVNCSGRLILPGNICAHTHLYSALARGMPGPSTTPRNFLEILKYVWWRLDRSLDEESIRYSALAGLLDAARAGTTTLVDHHSSPNFISGSLDILAGAFEQVGLRGVLCYEVTDRDGENRREAGLAESERFLQSSRRTVRGAVGAHASFTLEPETLQAVSELAKSANVGVHIHVAEDIHDEEDSMRRYGKRVADRLGDANILREDSILAHGVHLDRQELERVRSSRSWLVHNCRSNMNNHVGRAPLPLFGTRSALGTDGIDGDMFAESRTAFFRAREADQTASADAIGDMLARGGELASQYFGTPIGCMEPGAAADLVVVRYDPPAPLTSGNLAWHWMFGFTDAAVESVMVEGAWVLRDGEFPSVDEEKVRAEARRQAMRVWTMMETV